MVLRIFINVLTVTTGGTFQQLVTQHRLVKWVTIQNLTTTLNTLVTITSDLGTSNGINGATGKGVLLNSSAVAGTGGGTITYAPTYGEIDLFNLWWTATNTSDQIMVTYWEEYAE